MEKLVEREKRMLKFRIIQAKLAAVATLMEDELRHIRWELENAIEELSKEEGE